MASPDNLSSQSSAAFLQRVFFSLPMSLSTSHVQELIYYILIQSIRLYIIIYIYISIPGSSRYVKILPFGSFFFGKKHKFYMLGRYGYIYIYMFIKTESH